MSRVVWSTETTTAAPVIESGPWIVCPKCGYERPVGIGCGLPCV